MKRKEKEKNSEKGTERERGRQREREKRRLENVEILEGNKLKGINSISPKIVQRGKHLLNGKRK
jgi:hypothetical protein